MYVDKLRPAATASADSTTGTFTRNAHRKLDGNTAPTIVSMSTIFTELSTAGTVTSVDETARVGGVLMLSPRRVGRPRLRRIPPDVPRKRP